MTQRLAAFGLALVCCGSEEPTAASVSVHSMGRFWLLPAPSAETSLLQPRRAPETFEPRKRLSCPVEIYSSVPIWSSPVLELTAEASSEGDTVTIKYSLINRSSMTLYANHIMSDSEVSIDFDAGRLILKRQLETNCISPLHMEIEDGTRVDWPESQELPSNDSISGTVVLLSPLKTNYWPRIGLQLLEQQPHVVHQPGRSIPRERLSDIPWMLKPMTFASAVFGIGVSKNKRSPGNQATVYTVVAIPPTTVEVRLPE